MAKIFAGKGSSGVGEGVFRVCTKFGQDGPKGWGGAGPRSPPGPIGPIQGSLLNLIQLRAAISPEPLDRF